MELLYDTEADGLHWQLSHRKAVRTIEVLPGLNIFVDENDQPISISIEGASQIADDVNTLEFNNLNVAVPTDQYVTTAQARDLLGFSPKSTRVNQLIRSGKLVAVKFPPDGGPGSIDLIYKPSLDAMIEARLDNTQDGPGRPPKTPPSD